MLSVKRLKKTYVLGEGKVEAVRDISFHVRQGGFLTLLGPSGCGKTTTLRCVAGLETPDCGEIYIAGEPVFLGSQKILVPSYRRGVGMVFQSYAIWPHMTVFENVAFPLVHGGYKVPRAKVKEKVRQALALVGLAELENRPAPLLSGGQQQRVALARALVYEPKLLLLDEPLSNLDAKLRAEMRLELRELVKRLQISTVYVTHDQEEALVLSDEIAVMCEGRILQKGSPREIYLQPQHPFVASFVGGGNFLDGVVEPGANDGDLVVSTRLGPVNCQQQKGLLIGEHVLLVFRPEEVVIHRCAPREAVNTFPGILERVIFLGNRVQYEVRSGALVLQSESNSRSAIPEGTSVVVEIPPECIRVLRAGAARLEPE